LLQLAGKLPATGIGGTITQSFVEPAMLTFAEPAVGIHTYWLNLAITDGTTDFDGLGESAEFEPIPSVLGRDVLDNWLMVYSRLDGLLEFEVRRSDATNATIDQ